MIHKVSHLNGANSKILGDVQTSPCMLARAPLHCIRIRIFIRLYLSWRVNKQNSWLLTQLFVYNTTVLTKPTLPSMKYYWVTPPNHFFTSHLFFYSRNMCTLFFFSNHYMFRNIMKMEYQDISLETQSKILNTINTDDKYIESDLQTEHVHGKSHVG